MFRYLEVLKAALYILTAVALLRSIQAWFEGVRFRRRFRRSLAAPLAAFTPSVAVLAPCKGLDPGLEEGIRSLLTQDYPGYEVVFVLESPEDPALSLLRAAIEAPGLALRPNRIPIVFAGPCADCGQKVHNLRAALRSVSPETEVYAFVDSDVHPPADWLRRLVAPLQDTSVGAATGYRWYVPARGGLASGLLSAWNAIPLMLMGDDRWAFAWGGSMALRRRVFEHTHVLDRWSGAVSDDLGVPRAVRDAGLRIRFVPRCLVLSRQDATWPRLYEFVCRQYTIARVYAPALWGLGLTFSVIYAAAFFGGPLFAALIGGGPMLPMGAGLLYALTAFLGHQRLGLARLRFPGEAAAHRKTVPAHVLGAPLVTLLNLVGLVRAGLRRRITWRGVTYDLRGPNEVVIVRRSDRPVTPAGNTP